jgi:hypothetical protein
VKKKTMLLLVGAAAVYWFFLRPKRVAVAARPVLKSLPTDSMAAATMPGAVQGLITDGTRQVETATMTGFYG